MKSSLVSKSKTCVILETNGYREQRNSRTQSKFFLDEWIFLPWLWFVFSMCYTPYFFINGKKLLNSKLYQWNLHIEIPLQLKPSWRNNLERDWTGNPVHGYLNTYYAISEHYTKTCDTSHYLVSSWKGSTWEPSGNVIISNYLSEMYFLLCSRFM